MCGITTFSLNVCRIDDDSPLYEMARVDDGTLQGSLDATAKWMKGMGGDYHLTGPKAPVLMVYARKGTVVSPGVKNLTLEGVPISRVDRQRFLGVNVSVRALEGLGSTEIE